MRSLQRCELRTHLIKIVCDALVHLAAGFESASQSNHSAGQTESVFSQRLADDEDHNLDQAKMHAHDLTALADRVVFLVDIYA